MLNRTATYGILGAAAIAALSSAALAQSSPHNAGTEVPSGAAALVGLGCQDCFAVVRRDGNLARGRGVIGTSHLGDGQYTVAFQRHVRRCAFVATIGTPKFEGVEEPGFITVAGDLGTDNGVFIDIHDEFGRSADRAFHLIVQCPAK